MLKKKNPRGWEAGGRALIFAEDFHGAGDSGAIQYCRVVSGSSGGGASAANRDSWRAASVVLRGASRVGESRREMRFWPAGAGVAIAC